MDCGLFKNGKNGKTCSLTLTLFWRKIKMLITTKLNGKRQIEVKIREMRRSDMKEVLRIDEQSFENKWTYNDFLQHLTQTNWNCMGMVAERNEWIFGFMVCEFLKNQIHIINFAVDHLWRRYSIGSQMAQSLISKLSQRHFQEITLEVRESNLSAQLFWRSQGFGATCIWRGYHLDTNEDIYQMRYPINNVSKENFTYTHIRNRISGYIA